MSLALEVKFSVRKSTPVVLQTEAAECGLACLAMAAAYHGHDTDLPSLRRKHVISQKGTTLAHLMQIATALNFTARPLKVELQHLDKLQLPAIVHWDFNHFVVLTHVGARQLTVHDPAIGVRRLTLDEASKHFTGVALELTPAQGFEAKTERQRVRFAQLIGRLPGLRSVVTQILLLAVALEVFSIVSPFFMQLVVDSAIVAQDRDLITVLGLGFLLLALIQVAVTYLRSWVLMVLGTTLNLKMVSNLFRHMLRLPMGFFDKRHLGDIVSRYDSLSTIQRTLTTSFIEALVDGVMAVVTFIMMAIYSVKLALIVLGAAVLYALLRIALYRPLRLATEEQIVRGAKERTNLLETIRGVQSVKLFGREAQRESQYQNLLVDHFNAGIRVQRLAMLYRALNGALFGAENILVVWVGALVVLAGGFSVGMLFAFMAYKQQFISRIIGFIEKAIEFKMLGLHGERVADIALAEPEPQAPSVMRRANRQVADIEVRNVSFRYSDAEPEVLRNVNFKIAQGESVAIVGASGCGKTTLLKIILGLLHPSEGEVLVGGVSLSQGGLEQHRSLVGTVMQEDQLFAGSIADNICFFDAEPDEEHIRLCARLAAVHEDIEAMPMQYNTLIGDMGSALSGGQKQRVLLARALYKNPKILVLDEATSHLDVARERLVNESVRHLNLTRLIVAHRPETIASADRVIAFEKGEWVEPLVKLASLQAA